MATSVDYAVSRCGDTRIGREVADGPVAALFLFSSSPPANSVRRILYAQAAYDNTVTHTGVTFKITSGIGASYDITELKGAANAQITTFIPDTLYILGGTGGVDTFNIVAPSGGVGRHCDVIVVYEEIS